MVLLFVIISTFWLFYLVFPFAKHTAHKLPKIWNPEHGIRSTNCIYISSIAMNLKVIYVKHSEMSEYINLIRWFSIRAVILRVA